MITGSYTDNRETVNEKRLQDVLHLTKRTMSILMAQVDEGILAQIDSTESLTKFRENLENVVIDKMKKKFNL